MRTITGIRAGLDLDNGKPSVTLSVDPPALYSFHITTERFTCFASENVESG